MRCLFLFLALLTLPALAAESPKPGLLAGAATSCITPELGGEVVGGFTPYPARHIHDDLHARCLVLSDGTTKLALVVCDLLGVHRSVSVEARRLIEEAIGIPPSHVLISATHTHSATNAIGTTPRRYASDMELTPYQQFVARRIADGVRCAHNLLRPAEIAFGVVDAPEHVFNRRWFLKDGTMPVNPFGRSDEKVKMNPGGGSPDLVEPAGPVDPQLSFIALREPGGRLIALYGAYGLHYVGGTGPAHISADYYGVFCETLQRTVPAGREDPPFVAMLANGTSGDVNNVNFRQPRPRRAPYEQIRNVAGDVAGKVHQALSGLEWSGQVPLDARYRELDVAWRPIGADLLQWARETEAKTPEERKATDRSCIYAGRVQRLAEASPETKLPVQVLRLGPACIATTPCETFVETGLEFKERSPFPRSFMVSLAHGYYGYLPTPRHFALGGYETWPGTNNLEPDAAVKILSAVLEMADELHQAPAGAQ